MRALITGTNRGIGLEYVRQLAARGDTVFAACRQPDKADALQELKASYDDLITIVALEVADPSSITASAAAVREQTDALDLLINNAAILFDDDLGSFDLTAMQQIFTVNAIAPMLVTEQYIDLLKAGENPIIVNISSGAGSIEGRTELGRYSYGATKAALNFYTRNLSHQIKMDGIIAIALAPGWVRTDMGTPNATIDVGTSISGMLSVIDRLTMDDTGRFFNYTGTTVPW